ncbi:alpha/beta hydrolase family protein [Paraburkholderia azotifigens]|uniref:Dienelactone hydrolase n=1 Tax=Paraburkholderia azotifigens TaxID=2057004 RepID=A0A5C6VHA6_9BURK|nr:dienelactone hydrolase [Paraburkholderia azotifigens]TXC84527.1 dienelactone hydrolase [Paraburkholderia azotifigens]
MKVIISALVVCLSTTLAHAAGIKFVQVPSDAAGPTLKAMAWTPCAKSAQEVPVGSYVLKGNRDCPTVGERLPLIVISRGDGGSFLGHHDLAETLADNGFVVAAINHPGDTFSDMSRAEEMSEFVERPTDIKRLIDYMLKAAPDAARIDPGRIGFFGFSRGGYTGLVLAGGTPDFQHADVPCLDSTAPICQQIRRGEVSAGPLTRDGRIKAFVLADPFNAFPTVESLKNVKAPIQLWASEFGGDGVLPRNALAPANTLPHKPEYHLVSDAAHFAFLAPCPSAVGNDAPALCVDANGFDRTAFHKQFDERALEFFQTSLR